MRVSGRLDGIGGSEAIATNALKAGAEYTVQNNGPYDPQTAVPFATGHSMQYWIIVQALADQGASNLIAQVPDAWAPGQLQQSIQTSGPGGSANQSGQNINQVNVQSGNATLANIDNIFTQANVLQEAKNWANQAFAKVPAAVLAALNQTPVTQAQPTSAQVTAAVVTAPPPPAPLTIKVGTMANPIQQFEVPVFRANTGATGIINPTSVTTGLAIPTSVVSPTSDNYLMYGLLAVGAYFLLKR